MKPVAATSQPAQQLLIGTTLFFRENICITGTQAEGSYTVTGWYDYRHEST